MAALAGRFPTKLIASVAASWLVAAVGCGTDDGAPSAGSDGGTSGGGFPVGSSTSSGSSGAPLDASADAVAPVLDASAELDAGVPIVATPRAWTWVDFPGARCRDGSGTGIAVNLNPASDKVMLYLQGGGACFNAVSCSQNPSHFAEADFQAPTTGIFDLTDAANPVKDYNVVYVPYCTGDVHSGNATDVGVNLVGGKQQFVGYANLSLYLERLVPTFPGATSVLLTGESAGGFGAASNYEHVQRAFGFIPVDLLDDSGPPLGPSVVPPCLQKQWREAWGLDGTLIADCGATCDDPDDFLTDYVTAILTRHPQIKAGLVSSSADETIRTFFGFGDNDCHSVIPNVPANDYKAALLDFRGLVTRTSAGFGTYYIDSSQHTWLSSSFTTSVDGIVLRDWVTDMLAGQRQHVGFTD